MEFKEIISALFKYILIKTISLGSRKFKKCRVKVMEIKGNQPHLLVKGTNRMQKF